MNIQALACGYYHTYIGVSLVPSERSESRGPPSGHEQARQNDVEREGPEVVGGLAGCVVGKEEEERKERQERKEEGMSGGKMHKGARVKIVGLSCSRELNGQVADDLIVPVRVSSVSPLCPPLL